MAHSKHQEVRQRYDFCCGYCGVSEVDSGGELTVDHHQPISAGGGDEDENLVYACIRCNLYKGDFFPDADDAANGRRVLHPLRSDIGAHIRKDEATQRLEPLTETGRFHIALLHLNRPLLVEHRLRRRLADLLASERDLTRDENTRLHHRVSVLEAYIHLLHQLLGVGDAGEGA